MMLSLCVLPLGNSGLPALLAFNRPPRGQDRIPKQALGNEWKGAFMITYSKDELVSVNELSQHLADFLQRLHNYQQSKIAVINNNRPEAVLVNIEEYERLQEACEMLEHVEMY